jgi:RAB protein geranylgeranyltransferase component A
MNKVEGSYFYRGNCLYNIPPKEEDSVKKNSNIGTFRKNFILFRQC